MIKCNGRNHNSERPLEVTRCHHTTTGQKIYKCSLKKRKLTSQSYLNRCLPKLVSNIEMICILFRCFYQDCIAPADPEEVPPTREKPENVIQWSTDPNPCLEWTGDVSSIIIYLQLM